MNMQQSNNGFFEISEHCHPAVAKQLRRRNKQIADVERLERLRRLARKHGLRVVRPRGRLHPMAGTFGVVDESDLWVLCREVAEDEDDWGYGLTLAKVERGLTRLVRG